jgi:von Willebrand factor type A domain/Bacterial TSP3 repeat
MKELPAADSCGHLFRSFTISFPFRLPMAFRLRWFYHAFLAAVLALPFTSKAQTNCGTTAGLNHSVVRTIDNQRWELFYTTDTNRLEYVPKTRVRDAGVAAVSNYAGLVDVLGFRRPYFRTLPDARVYFEDIPREDVAGLNGPDCIKMDSAQMTAHDEQYVRQVLLHETFHAVQRRYVRDIKASGNGINFVVGGWATDGTAVAMQDRVYTDGDAWDGDVSFWKYGKNNLKNPTNGFYKSSARYDNALFWSYLCEQLGSYRMEPGFGYDFIQDYWTLVQTNSAADGVSALEDAITQHGGSSLKDLFHDFSICRFTHSYDPYYLPPDQYQFADESNGPAYNHVASTFHTNLPAAGTNHLDYLAADYQEAALGGGSCHAAGVRVQSPIPMGYALASVKMGTWVSLLSKNTGYDYASTFMLTATSYNTNLCLIVANLFGSAYLPVGIPYTWTIAEGDLDLSLVRPTAAHVQYAGPHDGPHPILARVYVEGPDELKPDGYGPRSVKGLKKYYFSADIGTNSADILLSQYIGNEYWLVIQPPEQDADGFYSLGISICEENVWNSKAVKYGNETIHHVVVVDNSGSMDAPAGSTKLDAAKNAAALYLYCVPESDQIGLVSFSGNVTECNDDAIDRAFGLDPATEFKKLACNLALYGISPSNRTSIGDGIMLAQDLLESVPPTNDVINAMVLLSDGMENEELYWVRPNPSCGAAPVSQRMLATNTMIYALALGPGADQGLMEAIGESTEGDFDYIDVEDSGGAKRRKAGTASLSLPNRLCDAYLNVLQKVRRLERLNFTATTIASGSTAHLDFPVLEGGVEAPLFFFAWDGPDDAADVALYDPDSNLIDTASATINTGAHLRVYFMNTSIGTGTWSAVAQGVSDCELIGGLLGRPTNDVFATVAFAQTGTGGTSGTSEDPVREHFEEGVPVTILALLADHTGPVTNVSVEIRITRPDGSIVCGPGRLLDDGANDDGDACDGVYGMVFTHTAQASTGGLDLDAAPATPAGTNAGTYSVELVIHGSTSAGGEFNRLRSGSFHVYRRIERDMDFDQIPDTWEVTYGTSPTHAADAAQDPDRDGLSNLEEYLAGTRPFNPDSDLGGESDGSEVAAGLCPFDPADDRLPIPIDIEVIDYLGDTHPPEILHPLANLLRYPVNPSYSAMRIFRDSSPTGTFPLLTEIAITHPAETCLYYDEGLTDGTTYYYTFQGVTSAGATTPLSRLVRGTARLHPVPPSGYVLINSGSKATDSLTVLLRLRASDDTTFYRVSSDTIISSEPWQILSNEYVTFTMDAPPTTPGRAEAHVQYMNIWSNTSEPSESSITYDPLGNADGDATPNNADPDDDNDGLSDVDEVFLHHTDPFNADSDGDGIEDGAEISTTGSNPRLDDSDSDGLLDADEIAAGTGITNPDSDGDGLLDGWEIHYGFLPLIGGEESLDPDHDGLNNLDEQATGTSPTDPSSVFAFTQTTPCAPDELQVGWPAIPQRMYRIEICDDLESPTWTTVETVTSTGSRMQHIINCPPTNGAFFYTIRLLP